MLLLLFRFPLPFMVWEVISSLEPEPSIKKAYDSDCAGDEECSAFLNVSGILLNALTKP